MCKKCGSKFIFMNGWSDFGYSKCCECGHDWEEWPEGTPAYQAIQARRTKVFTYNEEVKSQ